MSGLDLAFIERLPKTDLHCHLDGSLRLETILDLAKRQQVTLPASDPEQLGQILINLVMNAVQAMPDGGTLTVETGRRDSRLFVAVEDTGAGIDPANLANLPADARKACTETLKSASASGPRAPRGAADWKDHNPLSFCEPKNEPGHKLLLDHCSGVRTGVGFKLKYKF